MWSASLLSNNDIVVVSVKLLTASCWDMNPSAGQEVATSKICQKLCLNMKGPNLPVNEIRSVRSDVGTVWVNVIVVLISVSSCCSEISSFVAEGGGAHIIAKADGWIVRAWDTNAVSGTNATETVKVLKVWDAFIADDTVLGKVPIKWGARVGATAIESSLWVEIVSDYWPKSLYSLGD